jgi:hypothetical protein
MDPDPNLYPEPELKLFGTGTGINIVVPQHCYDDERSEKLSL